MARKMWIINLCLAIVICAVLFSIHIHKKAEIARSNETMTPEIEIPIEDDIIDAEGGPSEKADNANDSANDQKDMESEIENSKDEDGDSESQINNFDSDSSGSSDVELPVIP